MIQHGNIQWLCEVCRHLRPDEWISVVVRRHTFDGKPDVVARNVRYCNDRQLCLEGAVELQAEFAARLPAYQRTRRP